MDPSKETYIPLKPKKVYEYLDHPHGIMVIEKIIYD